MGVLRFMLMLIRMTKAHRQKKAVATGEKSAKGQKKREALGSAETPLSPLILIVEDVDIARELMAELLRFSSLPFSGKNTPISPEVVLAASVMEARRVLLWKRPALVLLDEVLPGESARDLLNDLIAANIPTLLLTSMEASSLAVERPIPPGALGRVRKPTHQGHQSSDTVFISAVLEHLKKN